MKKLVCLLLALLMTASAALADEADAVAMRIVSCPEQGFSTLCRPEYTYDFHPDGGLTLMLGDDATVDIFKADAPGSEFDADYYFNNVYLTLLEDSYGSDLLSAGDYTVYTLSGREMPGRLSLYLNDGAAWMRFCAMDLREDCFVRYEAFCPGVSSTMEATLTAVAVAVGNFQPDADYYSAAGAPVEAPEPEPLPEPVPKPEPEPVESAPADDLVYTFEDATLRLPDSWRGKVTVLPEGNGISFYQTASYEKYLAEGLEGGGFLFSLGASVNGSFSELPSFRYLGFSENSAMNYYLVLPTDYPPYNEPEIRAEYDAMLAQVDEVAANAVIDAAFDETVDAPDSGTGDDVLLSDIPCPELGFSTKADPAYSWNYQPGTGITIYTEADGSIPYVIVWQSEDLIGEPFEYIREQYTPHMQEKYGEDLLSFEEFDAYEIGGKQLPAGLYTYLVQGTPVDMLRLYDSTGSRTVAYTAKYIQGQGDATLAALDTAIRSFRAE